MRITTITVAVALVASPALLSAQMRSSSTAPETTFVKGTVTGQVPYGNYVITGSRSVYITEPGVTSYQSNTSNMSPMSTEAMPTTTETPPNPSLDKKVQHGAGEVGGDASKLGKKAAHGAGEAAGDVGKVAKKAAHGVKEAASDVKKKVTGKP